MASDWTCEAAYPACGCRTWKQHLRRNPCIEALGRQILADRERSRG